METYNNVNFRGSNVSQTVLFKLAEVFASCHFAGMQIRMILHNADAVQQQTAPHNSISEISCNFKFHSFDKIRKIYRISLNMVLKLPVSCSPFLPSVHAHLPQG